MPEFDGTRHGADLTVQPMASAIAGIWDLSDANALTPAPTASPHDFLDELADGNLFLMIHTRAFPGGAVGGVIVPEPGSASLAGWALLGVCSCYRRLKIATCQSKG